MKPRRLLIVAMVAGLMLPPGLASAQSPKICPEGKTASGQCVNPGLANASTIWANIFSQQKISMTAYPIMPSDDFSLKYPNQIIPQPPQISGYCNPLFGNC